MHGIIAHSSNAAHLLQVMEDLLLHRNYHRVIYLGDGRGDYCPCTRLGPNDHILARQNYPDGTACSLHKLIAGQGVPVKDSEHRFPPNRASFPHVADPLGRTAKKQKQCSTSESQRNSVRMVNAKEADVCQSSFSFGANVESTSEQKTTLLPPLVTPSYGESGLHGGLNYLRQIVLQDVNSSPVCKANVLTQTGMSDIHASAYGWTDAAQAANLLKYLLQQVLCTSCTPLEN